MLPPPTAFYVTMAICLVFTLVGISRTVAAHRHQLRPRPLLPEGAAAPIVASSAEQVTTSRADS